MDAFFHVFALSDEDLRVPGASREETGGRKLSIIAEACPGRIALAKPLRANARLGTPSPDEVQDRAPPAGQAFDGVRPPRPSSTPLIARAVASSRGPADAAAACRLWRRWLRRWNSGSADSPAQMSDAA
jgi:hypothetical protein